jgi:ubiquinone/menaquinone biosynthesis C-methylase UbiE
MTSDSIVFDRAADFYDATRGFPPGEEQHIGPLIAQAGSLMHSSRVLEVGIGTGRIALPLAGHVGIICGVDLSVPMLDKLREKRQDEPIHLAQADVTRLPFPAGVFDAVTATHIYHLVPNWQQGLLEAQRVLKPGAPLLACWNGDRSSPRLDKLWQAWREVISDESDKTVGIARDQFGTYPLLMGWRAVGEQHSHRFSFTTTPQDYIDRFEKRVFSGSWRLTDELVAQGTAAVKAAAAREFSDLNEPVPVDTSFNVQAYLPPQG